MKTENTTQCIFCEKPTKDENLVGFGDEYSCKKCHTEIFDEVKGRGKENIIDVPDGVNGESELYEYVDENYEWFEKQLGDTPHAWLILSFGEGKAKVKFI